MGADPPAGDFPRSTTWNHPLAITETVPLEIRSGGLKVLGGTSGALAARALVDGQSRAMCFTLCSTFDTLLRFDNLGVEIIFTVISTAAFSRR